MRRVVGGAIAFLVLLVAAGAVAASDNGLVVASDSTYEVRPDDGLVRVDAVYTLTNVTRNQTSGNQITQFYFDRFSVPVPVDALNVVAVNGGRELTLTTEPSEDGDFFEYLTVRLRRRIFYRQTTTFTLSYDLPGDAPRSEFGSRINPAYLHMFADGVGDDGKVSVRVVVPEAFEIETFGNSVTRSIDEENNTVLEAVDIEKPREWFLQVSARNDAELVTEDVLVGSRSLQVQSWPGDDAWADFVRESATIGIPLLEEFIGRSWPDDDTLEVQESFVPTLYGYAGWYAADLDRIELTEELNLQVLYHEISHVWFNQNLFEERWINEGLADEFAALVMRDQGFAKAPRPIFEAAPAAVLLNNWRSPFGAGEADFAQEDFGYNASWWVMREIRKEVGVEQFQKALDAVFDSTIVYRGETEPEPSTHRKDWRRLLDVFEQTAGSEEAADLFARYVIDPVAVKQVDRREEAREEYFELAEHGGDWAVPLTIRQAMDDWDFTQATEEMAEAQAVLDLRDDVISLVGDMDLVFSDALEPLYEEADGDYGPATARGLAYLDAMEQIRIATLAIEADRGVFGDIGRYGEDLESELELVREAFDLDDLEGVLAYSTAVVTHAEDTERVGRQRVTLGAVGLLLFIIFVVLLGLLFRRRRRRRRAAVSDGAVDLPHELVADLDAPQGLCAD